MSKVACEQCSKQFRNESGLRWHVEHMHGVSMANQPPSASLSDPQTTAAAVADAVAQEVEALQRELEAAREEYEEAMHVVEALSARVATLEPSAAEASLARQQVQVLERQLTQTKSSETGASQSLNELKGKFWAEQISHADEVKHLKQQIATTNDSKAKAEKQWAIWCRDAQQLASENEKLKHRMAELEPLLVWDGHPCKVCGKPMPGVVSREDAAKAMENFHHDDCTEGPGLGTIAVGAGLLYALLQAGKARQ